MIRRPNLTLLVCVLLCACVIGGCQSGDMNENDEKPADVKEPDSNGLYGSWVEVPAKVEAKAALRRQHRVWFFDNGQLTVEYKNEGWEVGRYQFVSGNGHKAIDLNVNSSKRIPFLPDLGPKTALLKGIYLLEGDSLKLCLAARHDAPRPTKFTTKTDSDSVVFEFRRGAPLKDTPESAADLKKLQGTWRVTELRTRGNVRQRSKTWRWRIVGDEMTWGEGSRDKPIFRLNANRQPKQIFMAHPDGDSQELLVAGIYELKDEKLKFCLNLGAHRDGFKRPTEFSSTGSDTFLLVTLEREARDSPAVPSGISREQLTASQHHAKQIQGTWRIIEETMWRQKLTADQLQLRPLVVVTADKIVFLYGKQQVVQEYRYTLDPNNDPARINLSELGLSDNDRIVSRRGDHRGIYSLSEKTLRLAFSGRGDKRPREFSPRTLNRTLVLERAETLAKLAVAANDLQQRTADMTRSRKNLTRLGFATYEFFEAHERLPTAAIVNKEGQSVLSWRVALLPYLGLADLHKQFKLDESWNSPHNKALLSKMPDVYAPVGVKTKEPFQTFYQVFVGKGTPFESSQGLRLISVKDGVGFTLLVVEAGEPVLWTRPVDLAFNSEKPLPKLGGLFHDRVHAVFLDASVRAIKQPFDESLFRLAITYDDLQPLDLKRLTQGKY